MAGYERHKSTERDRIAALRAEFMREIGTEFGHFGDFTRDFTRQARAIVDDPVASEVLHSMMRFALSCAELGEDGALQRRDFDSGTIDVPIDVIIPGLRVGRAEIIGLIGATYLGNAHSNERPVFVAAAFMPGMQGESVPVKVLITQTGRAALALTDMQFDNPQTREFIRDIQRPH